ncbi:MAG: tRNA (N(6)-L-threonylcarbamoyladenosine(37)-C(2))-methylthiotransferase MtaB [Candidatus Marinimicrobia bacterium]|nr:tRNA (N(6)-L-threonylcarbamoyladenosine(37)-C(2))-methylthiotransferase MtaB [Candidatus Neomarinimicrobiota bacterium]MDP6789312.1 tRNA (N(6)-L-threonylcarbamoyladenosine(37)-C(2))-methylthiotransferase MtaB [Candidatus Neomarinimicrobiota bacterium]
MSTPSKRVAFHTMGCKLNFSESSSISRDFIRSGFEKVDFRDEADIYVLNTCSVTENADKEARKIIRQAKRRNPDSAVAVIGCYAQLKPDEIGEIEGVDIVLGAEEKFNLLDHLDEIELNGSTTVIKSKIDHVNSFTPSYSSGERTRSFLKVQDGCDYTCSFCTIPLARGKSRSGTIKDTMKIAREVAATDAREIVLTGVNIGDFGKDRGESLLDLIKKMDAIDNIDRIRISSIEPNLITDDIIDFCSSSRLFMPHFHVPLQSGSDKILGEMKRRYITSLYENRIAQIKKRIPDACIGVDVIIGFPGETEDDFSETCRFLHDLDISYLHIFSYSERANTPAASMEKKTRHNVKKERSSILHHLSDKKLREFQNQHLHEVRNVLVETELSGTATGHTDNYIKVEFDTKHTENISNTIQSVEISEIKNGYVIGEMRNNHA